MEDFPWLPVAMIFIAFVGWVRNRIQAVAESRRERREERADPRPRARAATSVRTAPQRQPSSSGADTAPPPPESLSEVFEHIRRNWEEQDSPPPPEPPARQTEEKVQPPPLPSSRRRDQPADAPVSSVPDESREIQDETAALGAIPAVSAEPPAQRSYRAAKFDKRSPVASRLVRSLKDRDQLRSALLLKEILDSPVSLREGGH